MDISNRVFFVVSNDKEIIVYTANEASISQNLDGTADFRASCFGHARLYTRDNKYLPITEKEIAELFIEQNEVLTEG
jgi:hypothetical protein